MKLDFSIQLKDVSGDLIDLPSYLQEKNGKHATLRTAALEALMHFDPNKPATGGEKYKCWQLAKRIHREGSVDMTSEDVVFIKEKIGNFWSPNVVGAAYDLLEGVQVEGKPALEEVRD